MIAEPKLSAGQRPFAVGPQPVPTLPGGTAPTRHRIHSYYCARGGDRPSPVLCISRLRGCDVISYMIQFALVLPGLGFARLILDVGLRWCAFDILAAAGPAVPRGGREGGGPVSWRRAHRRASSQAGAGSPSAADCGELGGRRRKVDTCQLQGLRQALKALGIQFLSETAVRVRA